MKRHTLFTHSLILAATIAAAGCSGDDIDLLTPQDDGVTLKLSLAPFEGEPALRTSTNGLSMEKGDQFRMKVICPHTDDHQSGEVWGSGYYGFTIDDTGSTYISSGQSVEAQATTYVYTAQNTTGTRIFVVNNNRYTRPSNFFCADQSKLEHFKQSDVIWAQAIRQTRAKEVHLMFAHKVARLDITIDDEALTQTVDGVPQPYPLTDAALLTLEGMPDIDGAELVIGDYYADRGYENDIYSYREKASCSYENNGRVLGIEVLEETLTGRSSIATLTGGPANPGGANSRVVGTVSNTATYTAYADPDQRLHYLLRAAMRPCPKGCVLVARRRAPLQRSPQRHHLRGGTVIPHQGDAGRPYRPHPCSLSHLPYSLTPIYLPSPIPFRLAS